MMEDSDSVENPTVREINADIDSRIFQVIEKIPGTTLSGIVRVTSILNRVVDRSLQRLRKQGKIKYGGPGTSFVGWRVVPGWMADRCENRKLRGEGGPVDEC